MGVNISDIVPSKKRELREFRGRVIAIDAYNAIYQFLSIIRQPDGTPLMDSTGRVTSHLSGLIYRTSNLLKEGMKPVYVFDGKPPDLKKETVKARAEARETAKEEWKAALAAGDIEKAFSKATRASKLKRPMVEQSKELISKLGIPWVQAPSEGEAQASYMGMKEDVWAAGSQDFDSLLFGSPRLIRNLTITGKRKLPGKQIYVNVQPEEIDLSRALSSLEINRDQLIDLSLLVGTDFNPGIKGIGPKKALSLIRKHGDLDTIMEKEGFIIEGAEDIKDIFLRPDTTDDYTLEWAEPDEEDVLDFLCGGFDFSEDRVRSALNKIAQAKDMQKQKSLDRWF
ncbi:MAG: flap endonuclease-1 [Methanomassiliicoccales archaeon]|nr:MAG: flap endonuclease-1 [Methanomassiliicoccales archaeon]